MLVNNAGATKLIPHADLEAASLDVWREIFEVNVFGTWSLCVAAMAALRESHGAIVNVSSLAGGRPLGSSIPYAASKAAVNHMTVLLAKVVGPEVRVNAVAPGLIDTPWTEEWDTVRGFVRAVAPLKRSGTPEDVAGVIVTLASATYVTGQVVVIDGGLGIAHVVGGGGTKRRSARQSSAVAGTMKSRLRTATSLHAEQVQLPGRHQCERAANQ